MRYSATLLCIPINFDLIRCSAIYCHVLQLVMVFTFTCVCVLLLILILFFCTETIYCCVLQLEMHVRLICAIKFYLLTYLLTIMLLSPSATSLLE